jgi:hypothetical protein
MAAPPSTGAVASVGRIKEPGPVPLPAEVTAVNLLLAVDALEAGRVPYWVVRAEGHRHRVAVPATSRAAALTALAAPPGAGAPGAGAPGAGTVSAGIVPAGAAPRAEVFGADGTVAAVVPLPDLPGHPAAADAAWLRVFHRIPTASSHLTYGPRFGVDVEFWAVEERRLIAPRPTLIGRVVHTDTPPAVMSVAGRRLPTLEPFTRRLPPDIVFPIDAVYLWVDGDDPAWRRRLAEAVAAGGVEPSAYDPARFRDRGELRYSLRSLEMYAPWIRHIHIVTAGQVPAWLTREHPRVSVVDHADIAGDTLRRPSFSSRAISTALHRIDGLAEHFIYFNDDFFLGRPVAPTTFFDPNGAARFFPSSVELPFTPAPGEPFSRTAARNNRAALEREFGWTATHLIKHAPYPVRRSVLAEVAERFADEVAGTAGRPFRSRADIEPITLAHWYGYLTGRAVRGSIANGYLDTSETGHEEAVARLLRSRPYDCFCLNDTPLGPVPAQAQADWVASLLADYFPVPTGFERADVTSRVTRALDRLRGRAHRA